MASATARVRRRPLVIRLTCSAVSSSAVGLAGAAESRAPEQSTRQAARGRQSLDAGGAACGRRCSARIRTRGARRPPPEPRRRRARLLPDSCGPRSGGEGQPVRVGARDEQIGLGGTAELVAEPGEHPDEGAMLVGRACSRSISVIVRSGCDTGHLVGGDGVPACERGGVPGRGGRGLPARPLDGREQRRRPGPTWRPPEARPGPDGRRCSPRRSPTGGSSADRRAASRAAAVSDALASSTTTSAASRRVTSSRSTRREQTETA